MEIEDQGPTGNEFANELGELINRYLDLPALLILKIMAGAAEDLRALQNRLEIQNAFNQLSASLDAHKKPQDVASSILS